MNEPPHISRRHALVIALGAMLGSTASLTQAAQSAASAALPSLAWPGKKTIKVIVVGQSGELADNMFRMYLSDRMAAQLMTHFELQNLFNDQGRAGMAALAKASADGYTMAFCATSTLTLMPLIAPTPYDGSRDFLPVASVFAQPNIVVATGALSRSVVPHFEALLALARDKNGSLRWASVGQGSIPHLILEQIKASKNLQITHVPYNDLNQLIVDAKAAKFDVACIASEPITIQHIMKKLLRPLAVAAPARMKELLPGVSTLDELKMATANIYDVYGFFAPKGTPGEVAKKMAGAIITQCHDAEVRHHIDTMGLVAINDSGDAFSQQIARSAQYIKDGFSALGATKGH